MKSATAGLMVRFFRLTMAITAQSVAESGILPEESVRSVLSQGLAGKFRGQRVLALIPIWLFLPVVEVPAAMCTASRMRW